MNLRVFTFVLGLSVLNVAQGTVANKIQPVDWYADFQTEQIIGEDAQQFDTERRQLTMLYALIPDTQFNLSSLSIGQGLNRIQYSDNPGCVSNTLKNQERVDQFWFSLPFSVTPAHHLFYLSQNSGAAQLVTQTLADQHLDFAQFLRAAPMGSIGISNARSYGAEIDALLQLTDNQRAIYHRGSQEKTIGLLQMLFLGRVDFIIEYPVVVAHLAAALNDEKSFTSHPIKQAGDDVISYIACNRAAEQSGLTTKIDQALKTLAANDDYYQLMKLPYLRHFTQAFDQSYQRTFVH